MFKLNILGENDKVEKTYETAKIKYGLMEDLVLMSEELEGKNDFQQFILLKPILKTMFTGITDDELRNVDFEEVLGVFKNLMNVATEGYANDKKK